MWRSRTGWIFSALHLLAALFLFRYAFTCGSMLCDLAAFPVFLPVGAIYWWAYQLADKLWLFGYVASPC